MKKIAHGSPSQCSEGDIWEIGLWFSSGVPSVFPQSSVSDTAEEYFEGILAMTLDEKYLTGYSLSLSFSVGGILRTWSLEDLFETRVGYDDHLPNPHS